jgi:predicted nucleotide-binding protein
VGGRTLPPGDVSTIKIAYTDSEQATEGYIDGSPVSYRVVTQGRDVTNHWIAGAPGHKQRPRQAPESELRQSGDPRRVMVVHGRNKRARDAMFTFLRALGLSPVEWEQAVAETGFGTPHNLEAVRAAMTLAQAVVVILTAEDQGGLFPELAGLPDQDDTALRGQPRQNVTLEAGLAIGVDPRRTILVELGEIRRASDFEGLNTVRLTNHPPARAALRTRLETAGCAIDDPGFDWMTVSAGGDFEGCVIRWEPQNPPQAVVAQMPVRETSPPEATDAVRRTERQSQGDAHFEKTVERFLERQSQIDQPFEPDDLQRALGEPELDTASVLRIILELEEKGRVDPNPDGPGWYPSETR